MCEILKKERKPSDTDRWLPRAGSNEMCEWGQKIQTSIYEIGYGGECSAM